MTCTELRWLHTREIDHNIREIVRNALSDRWHNEVYRDYVNQVYHGVVSSSASASAQQPFVQDTIESWKCAPCVSCDELLSNPPGDVTLTPGACRHHKTIETFICGCKVQTRIQSPCMDGRSMLNLCRLSFRLMFAIVNVDFGDAPYSKKLLASHSLEPGFCFSDSCWIAGDCAEQPS